jgi:hypothetical protein
MMTPIAASAQWLNYPSAGLPRTRDGKPILTAPAPRLRDGKLDLSGVWQTNSAPREISDRFVADATNGAGEEYPTQYFLNILSDFKAGEEPLLPVAAEAFRLRTSKFSEISPLGNCLPSGLPLAELATQPYKIIQTRAEVVILYERDTTFRQIHTDGRKLPEDPQPSWLGYSVGRWEGDTLVVDTIGLNDRAWLDARGHTHSEELHLRERFHRLDVGHMDVDLTFDDPKTFTRPFTIKLKQSLLPDTDVLEDFCTDNERDQRHISGK